MNRKSLIMVYMLPNRFIRFLLWSTFFGILINHFILDKSWQKSFADLYILFFAISGIISYRILRFIVRKLLEVIRGDGAEKYVFNKYDKKRFDKRYSQFRFSLKWVWHIMKIAFRYDESDIRWTGRQEMVIRYPLNPNLIKGDIYHIQAISSHKIEHEGRRWYTLQAYCYELQKIMDFDVDKIQQAYDFQSGKPVSTNELMA